MRGTPTEDASCSCYNAQFEGEWHFYCLLFFHWKLLARTNITMHIVHMLVYVYGCAMHQFLIFHMISTCWTFSNHIHICGSSAGARVRHMMLINSLIVHMCRCRTQKWLLRLLLLFCLGSRALSAVKTHKINLNLNISFMSFLVLFSIPNN